LTLWASVAAAAFGAETVGAKPVGTEGAFGAETGGAEAGGAASVRSEAAAPGGGNAATEACIRQALTAEARFDPAEELRWYLQADQACPDDPRILRGLAKAWSDSTLATEDPKEKRRRIEQSLACAQRACDLEPSNAVNQLSLAVCYGKLGLYAEVRDRVDYARQVKRCAERALALDPNYAYAHHVLGQWNYEVASLGRTKRFLVGLLFGGLPDASTGEAVRQLERAVALSPETVSHRLALGYAYLADGQPERATRCFEQVLTMPKRELYDDDCRIQARQTLASLNPRGAQRTGTQSGS
jgi:tetratricopeptide (TPR) repeat protein